MPWPLERSSGPIEWNLYSEPAAWARSIERADTVLGRQVAIKLLPADVSSDPERIARLRREARVLAALNHVNIGAIYGLEAFNGKVGLTCGLVLELVDGRTLAERLVAGRLRVAEALDVARQIAGALEAAHLQGSSIAI